MEQNVVEISNFTLTIGIILGSFGAATLVYLIGAAIMWPYMKFTDIDESQDLLIEDIAAIKKKLNIKDES